MKQKKRAIDCGCPLKAILKTMHCSLLSVKEICLYC